MSSLDAALQRALSTRLSLQVSLSQLPIVEEWMDIHLDRWLEHNPMPPEMPPGEMASYLAMFGSDLRRVWWGAWGDPRGFVPKLADYFKLCNIAKSDAQLLDQIGEALEPKLVGSWIGVWGGKVTTGWHFVDPHPWPAVEAMFGTHEAKYQLKKLVDELGVSRIERFAQSIGDDAYSEIELAMPGDSAAAQVAAVDRAFAVLTGAPLPRALGERWAAAGVAALSLSVRIRGGHITRVGAAAPGVPQSELDDVAVAAQTGSDGKLAKLIQGFGGIARLEYGRAGERAGLDVYVEPGHVAPSPAATSPPMN